MVCLNDGNYAQSVRFPSSGTSSAWITLTAVNPWAATVTSVSINSRNYIEVDNLHVTGGSDAGISAQGGHHTRVIGNLVENMPGGGINLNAGDYRTIQGNTVRGCSAGTSGSTSAISIYEAAALDTAPGYHNYVGFNTVYSNHNPVGGTDGNGIIYDDANGSQSSHVVYLGGALIEENLTWDNGGSGIKVFESQNALVRNNVAYWNGSFTSNSFTYRGEISSESAANNVFVNNVMIANSALNSSNTAICECGSVNDIWNNNLTFDTALGAGHSSLNGKISGSGNLLGVDPMLVNPPTDMHLSSGSPAIGAGSSAYGMPGTDFAGLNWNTIDVGAYAYAGRSGPTPTPTQTPTPTPTPTPLPSASPVPTPAPISLIQQVTQSCGGCTSTSVPITVQNSGSTLILLIAINTGGATVSSVTDNNGGAWAQVDPLIYPARAGSDPSTLDAWIASNHAGGATTVSLTLSAAKNFNISLLEYTGVSAVSPLDVDTKTRNNLVTGTVTTTFAPDLLVGAVSAAQLTPPDPPLIEYGGGGGIPTALTVVNATVSELVPAVQVVTAPGTYGFQWANGLSTVGMIFALKGTGGGSPTPTATSPASTPSTTPIPTRTPAPTSSPTLTATPTPTPTPSQTATATPTRTPTPSPTTTAPPTPTPTHTQTATATPARSPTPSPTPTATLKPTSTPSRTASATPTPTPRPSQTPTATPTSGLQTVTVSTANLSFGSVAVGSTSGAQSATVINGQPVAISLSASLGGSNPSQFAISASGTTCGSQLAANSKCVYAVTFKPKSRRSYTAALKIKASPDPASPHSIALSGSGV